ncbi:hypothetical protein M0R45_017886 [Rubus argutus]|uniref:Uncharacterized protein n=1 Tax=Rubus argutus TaxID=59490 RepID=A0AAW1XX08_RUBAR
MVVPIGPKTALDWALCLSRRIRELLLYTKNKYMIQLSISLKNGVNELNDPGLSLEEALTDYHRIDYYECPSQLSSFSNQRRSQSERHTLRDTISSRKFQSM